MCLWDNQGRYSIEKWASRSDGSMKEKLSQDIWEKTWVLDVCLLMSLPFMDCQYRKELKQQSSLSWLCCTICNLCSCLYISMSWTHWEPMSDLLIVDVEGTCHLVMEDKGPSVSQVSHRLSHRACFYPV